MLKIRLQRIGRKNDPAFRVIVTESSRGPKSGNHVELLGSYNPRQKTSRLDAERIKHWISKGAQVSGTMNNLLVAEKIIDGKKMNVLPRKSPIVKAEEPKEESVETNESTEATPTEAPAVEENVSEKTEEVPVEAEQKVDDTPADTPQEEAPSEEKAGQ